MNKITKATATINKVMMKKISAETDVIDWVEVPALDSSRAKNFYETIFNIRMNTGMFVTKGFMGTEMNERMTFFPSVPVVIQVTSGRVTSVLVKSGPFKPSAGGALIYLNAEPHIQTVIDKIEPAGGKVIVPKFKNLAGYLLFSQTLRVI